METIYLAFVVILFVLAISDLVVGVSNDAVNFLNAAVGAKAASFKVVIAIAALGVLLGSIFSSGMMEIARSGIFHPEKFYFNEVMLIFLAVMITDVILLDTFNSFGLPTSTTVSIVFELLGASVAIAMMKVLNSPDPNLSISQYINTSKALAIISGILLSVVVAFGFGALIQFITRVLFSFNYKKRLKYLGSVFGGLSLTGIVYFMLIKGMKGTSFITPDMTAWITENTAQTMLMCFVVLTVLFQLLIWFFNVNVLKIVVLSGTFALAMAFAGNDLVNFIGVPLAGFESYTTWIKAGTPDDLLMNSLQGEVKTPIYFLLVAGLVMVVTLFTSRKARTVIETTVNLSRQDQRQERFGSTQLSRNIVKIAVATSESINRIVPKPIKKYVEKQFTPLPKEKAKDAPAFDMLRAAVSLVVASILIALGTSLKLPLSTTYVTFMVAMGTSLSDRAWGRDSAVFRITGVFSVVGGWFFTAISASTLTFLVALLFHFGGIYAITAMILLAVFLMIKTHRTHKKKEKQQEDLANEIATINADNIVFQNIQTIVETLQQTQRSYKKAIKILAEFDEKEMRKTLKEVEAMEQKIKFQKDNITYVIEQLKIEAIDSAHFYVQVLDYLREITHCLHFVIYPALRHIMNNHKELSSTQKKELKNLSGELSNYLVKIATEIQNFNFTERDGIVNEQQNVLGIIELFQKNEIKRVKKEARSTRNSMLFINILQETKSLVLHSTNLYKSERDFVTTQQLFDKTTNE
ncbi:MAG: inorganic phosphate transporter [Lentimicrobiaceae bacterium]|jgi:phosphate/sulfate permease|nr:inorganic phosphate transporter [Lentimicrobiaceae bacterium]